MKFVFLCCLVLFCFFLVPTKSDTCQTPLPGRSQSTGRPFWCLRHHDVTPPVLRDGDATGQEAFRVPGRKRHGSFLLRSCCLEQLPLTRHNTRQLGWARGCSLPPGFVGSGLWKPGPPWGLQTHLPPPAGRSGSWEATGFAGSHKHRLFQAGFINVLLAVRFSNSVVRFTSRNHTRCSFLPD